MLLVNGYNVSVCFFRPSYWYALLLAFILGSLRKKKILKMNTWSAAEICQYFQLLYPWLQGTKSDFVCTNNNSKLN